MGERKEGSGLGAKGCETGCMRWWRIGVLEEGARFSRLPEKGVKDWSVRLPIKCDLLLLRSRCSAGDMEPWFRGYT